ncbi:hypothetical protein PPTG_01648 [Plasmopara halstedii]|uniref:FAD-binding FR-type domain-containing protein n=1 Tax=Plasmopara halstedii TaxID=4781 RepID=A0A0P1AMV0_PLAHL|nr:hypothetical protein PPTG_01648 [Plasmopara halstedii]CEG42074.1 hypothetical protein PPTG_01648 [Plasmopara halstedii]|eukprot:XP_024578443.1 hypothetical protein PPTG_01648 [Plasmopara halstedii]
MSVRVEMERRRALSPPRSPKTDPDLDLLLDESLNDIPDDRLSASKTYKTPKRRRLKVAILLQLLSKVRHNSAKAFLVLCTVWILFSLVWIRWPIYESKVVPSLKMNIRESMDVEPFVVSIAVILPFFLAGLVFYSKKDTIGTIETWGHQNQVVQWVQSSSSIGKSVGFDALDIVLVGGFLLLQLNLVVGKLLIDLENGKLAKSGIVIRTGRALGMNGLYAIILSVILIAKQSFVHKFFGLSEERAARYHVLSGQFGFSMLMLHGLVYLVVWYSQGKVEEMLVPCLADTCSSKQRYGSIRNFCGALALCFSMIVAISSMEWVRRRFFRTFVMLHCLIIGVIVFSVLHYYATFFWLIPAIVLVVMYRVVSMCGRGQASVISATAVSNKVFEIELRRSSLNGSDFLPGQYVYIKHNAIGNEWHPFTISSSPLRNRHSFFINAKVQGFFTSRILTAMRNQQLKTVHVDGYYGSEIKLAPHMVFIAGGSGMTPFLSVLDHLKALLDVSNAKEVSKRSEIPQSLWIIWTCRDMEFLEAHAELLDAINRCSQWNCQVWLHLTKAGSGSLYDSEEDDTQTEPDDLSATSSPRPQYFYPSSLERHAFHGHDYMLSLPLFTGTMLGCLLSIIWVLSLESLTAKSFVKRLLLLTVGILGAVLGASFMSCLLRRNVCKDEIDMLGGAMEELEIQGLDVSTPTPPTTPRAMPIAEQSVFSRNFLIEKIRPNLALRLREIHSDIGESFGVQAKVALYVSGPSDLQFKTLAHAREFQAPAFEIHRKSFLL